MNNDPNIEILFEEMKNSAVNENMFSDNQTQSFLQE
jgi:hypothetical protein